MKCCECSNEATFISPKQYCDFHWAVWWMEGYEKLMSKSAYLNEFNRILIQAKRNRKKKKI